MECPAALHFRCSRSGTERQARADDQACPDGPYSPANPARSPPLWDKALDGDLRAVAAIVRIIMARARLLGLDQVTTKSTGHTTVVDPSFWSRLDSKTVEENGLWEAARELM